MDKFIKRFLDLLIETPINILCKISDKKREIKRKRTTNECVKYFYPRRRPKLKSYNQPTRGYR